MTQDSFETPELPKEMVHHNLGYVVIDGPRNQDSLLPSKSVCGHIQSVRI